MLFCHLLFFFSKLTFSEKFFREYHQSVKWFGSRSRPDILLGLIWVHTVCKGNQQTTPVGKEFKETEFTKVIVVRQEILKKHTSYRETTYATQLKSISDK